MSTPTKDRPIGVPDIRARKGKEPLVCLTAYTAPIAKLLDRHVDLLLVGDSLAMVVYGMDSTLGVSLDMMIAHGKAVARSANHACVVVDLPFGSYEESPELAYRSAARVLAETGCAAVKLEGGLAMAPTIRFLTDRHIPVLAHIGLTPQSVNAFGGFRVQGRGEEQAAQVMADAHAVTQAGAFAVVIEGVPEPLGRAITQAIGIPTIRFLTDRHIPVLAHIGLTPQSVNAFGGFRVQGRGEEQAAQVMADAHAVTQAGAFAVVIEGVPEPLGRAITQAIGIPTIGIGASPSCDGQILVTDDMLGLFSDFTPKFVKRFAALSGSVEAAAQAYAAEVTARSFPGPEHCFGAGKPKGGA
jgi:3-methyl-2-oxobutanoate hydroxymethyltransferase